MKVVLFGNGSFASMAWYWLSHDSPLTVTGFTVDDAYMRGHPHHGLPVVQFETVQQHFPPDDHLMLLPIGAVENNALRAEKCLAAKAKGYRLTNYLSSRAIAPPGLELRENSMIFEGTVIQPFASIGTNVIIRTGVQIGHHVTVQDDCFIAAGACIGGGAVIGTRCFIGLNATVLNDVEVAPGCTIAAGSVLTKAAKQAGTYMGVPAKFW